MSQFAYSQFLKHKQIVLEDSGMAIDKDSLNPKLFEFQRDIVAWSLRKGRAAIFLDCGMGKTVMQLEFAKHVPGKVLILAPLAVAQQTEREGAKFGIDVLYSRKPVDRKITITNYEMLEHFNPADYNGIVLDESSILKSFEGKFRTEIINSFSRTPYRLACTATPAPNDYMELGNHSEFLIQVAAKTPCRARLLEVDMLMGSNDAEAFGLGLPGRRFHPAAAAIPRCDTGRDQAHRRNAVCHASFHAGRTAPRSIVKHRRTSGGSGTYRQIKTKRILARMVQSKL
jgi:hypothetical protein